MTGPTPRICHLGLAAAGGVVGGLAGAAFAVGVTQVIKEILAVVTRQDDWLLIVVPLVGLTLAVVVLHIVAHGEAVQHIEAADVAAEQARPPRFRVWRAFPADLARADLTADVVRHAGSEERFPWRLAPVRALAIVSTVGLGAPMGTEAPAAHLGVAAGAAIGEPLPRVARAAALGGGAAGVAALMGLPLVGLAFMLELGRRRNAPLSPERVIAAAVGAIAGWAINQVFDLNLIQLVVPRVAPDDLPEALATALLVGAVAGGICSLTGAAIYRARAWEGNAALRLVVGAAGVAAAALAIGAVAIPAAGVGPGGGAVAWAETFDGASTTLLVVSLLRAFATTAAVAAGGCGGVFVPFLAIGDIAGRAFAPTLGVSGDLAGAAGAAGGIAGGYRLPWTAAAMVIGIGGPFSASATCLATVVVAAAAGVGTGLVLDRVTKLRPAGARRSAPT